MVLYVSAMFVASFPSYIAPIHCDCFYTSKQHQCGSVPLIFPFFFFKHILILRAKKINIREYKGLVKVHDLNVERNIYI